MQILTDFPTFPARWKAKPSVEGTSRTTLVRPSLKRLPHLMSDIRNSDLIVVHQNVSKALGLAALFTIAPPLKKPLILVDAVFSKPQTKRQKVRAWMTRLLLRRVDHFIHYFRELNGYQKVYGISPDRSSYVPFKANLYGDSEALQMAETEKEEYVFAAGWSLRDYDTFIKAISRLDCRAALCHPLKDRLQKHGARFTHKLEHLPENLVVLPNDGTRKDWIRNLSKARIVVIPLLRESMRAAGISVYMDAMLLGKCVIVSEGPGVSDVLTDQAILVPPEDPQALARAINRAWKNRAFSQEMALRGQSYAMSMGGEQDLMNRILDSAVDWYMKLERT
jgi:glycosyltransferase involved in cell wall biosynthesis